MSLASRFSLSSILGAREVPTTILTGWCDGADFYVPFSNDEHTLVKLSNSQVDVQGICMKHRLVGRIPYLRERTEVLHHARDYGVDLIAHGSQEIFCSKMYELRWGKLSSCVVEEKVLHGSKKSEPYYYFVKIKEASVLAVVRENGALFLV